MGINAKKKTIQEQNVGVGVGVRVWVVGGGCVFCGLFFFLVRKIVRRF